MRLSLILGGARSGKSARALALATPAPRVFVATAEALDAEMAERIARHRAGRGAGWRLVEAPLDLAPVVAAHREGAMVIDCLTLWLSNLMHAGRDPAAETAALLDALAAAGAIGEDRISKDRSPAARPPSNPPAGYLAAREPGAAGASGEDRISKDRSPAARPPSNPPAGYADARARGPAAAAGGRYGETPSPVVYPPGIPAGAQPPRIVLVSNEVGLSVVPENALARRFRDEQGRLNQRVAAVAEHVELVAAGLPLALKGSP